MVVHIDQTNDFIPRKRVCYSYLIKYEFFSEAIVLNLKINLERVRDVLNRQSDHYVKI